jgi:hypothetical protein
LPPKLNALLRRLSDIEFLRAPLKLFFGLAVVAASSACGKFLLLVSSIIIVSLLIAAGLIGFRIDFV